MTTLTLTGLRIDTSRLDTVSTATEQRRTHAASGRRGPATQVVSADVLAETRTAECKCEDEKHMATLGLPTLHAGTPIQGAGGLRGLPTGWDPELERHVFQFEDPKCLGSGCTTGRHVCSRLDKVRRRYGI